MIKAMIRGMIRRMTKRTAKTILRTTTATAVVAVLTAATVWAARADNDQLAQSDKAFAGRDNTETLRQAAALAEAAATRDPANYEAHWRVARSRYYLADREQDKAKKGKLLDAGIAAAKRAIELNDKRVEGHFWLAANTGDLADIKGALSSLGLVKTIRKEFEAALSIDPLYHDGAAYNALGQLDLNLPRLFGGNERRGIETLETGLKAAPKNAELKVALAEIYAKKGRKAEARSLLESVLSDTDPALSAAELRDERTKAQRALDKLN